MTLIKEPMPPRLCFSSLPVAVREGGVKEKRTLLNAHQGSRARRLVLRGRARVAVASENVLFGVLFVRCAVFGLREGEKCVTTMAVTSTAVVPKPWSRWWKASSGRRQRCTRYAVS